MTIILETEIYVQYSQLGLVDVEDKTSYPQWVTGQEFSIFEEKGIVVATENDIKVKVIISSDTSETNGSLIDTGTIQIGTKGFMVGNIVTNDLHKVNWPPGEITVNVYADEPGKARSVEFFLRQAN